MRVLALDVGERRIGVAVSDALSLTAQAVDTIETRGFSADVQRILEWARYYDTTRVLVGLPRTLRGELGPQATRIQQFAEQLAAATGFTIRYADERLTTRCAERVLIEGGVRRKNRKQYIDRLAATYILQSFLDAGGWQEPRQTTEIGRGVYHMDKDFTMSADDRIELIDENGVPTPFEHIMTIAHEGEKYVFLTAVEPSEDLAEDEMIVLHIEPSEDGNDAYVGVEDEDLLETLYQKYLEIAEADEDDDEDYDEDDEDDDDEDEDDDE